MSGGTSVREESSVGFGVSPHASPLQSLPNSYRASTPGASDGRSDDSAASPEVSATFTQIRSVVEADRYVKIQLRQLRSALKRDQYFEARRSLAAASRSNTRTLDGGPLGEASEFGGERRSSMTARTPRESRCLRCVHFVFGNTLHPEGRFRSVWNAAMAVLILYCSIAIPIEIAFEDDLKGELCREHLMSELGVEGYANFSAVHAAVATCPSYLAWFWFNVMIDFVFMVDIVLNMRTGYMNEGQIVRDDWQSLLYYLRGWFVPDLIGSFPVTLILHFVDDCTAADGTTGAAACNLVRGPRMLKMLRMFKLTKLTRFFKLSAYLTYIEMLIKFNPGLLRVFKLAIIAVFSCHFFGCVWWFVSDIEMAPPDAVTTLFASLPPGAGAGMTEDDVDNGWWPAPWLKHSGRLELKYFHAFYWGAGIALGMTPIDIVPMTTVEAVVTTVLLFFGLLLNAFVISSFTSAFAAIDNKNQLAGKQLDLIRNYLLLKAVPADVRSRILEYFQYIYTSSQSMDEVSQLQHMPPSLTTQLALSVNRELIRNCDFFCDVSNTALVAIVMRLEPLVFVPGQVIAAEGAPLHHIYFINRGKVEVYARLGQEDELGAPTEELVMTLSENDNIGMDEYLGLGHRGSDRGSARSRTTSSSGGAAGPVSGHESSAVPPPAAAADGWVNRGGVRSASPVAGAPHAAGASRAETVCMRLSALAVSYCDVMRLSTADLSDALANDSVERERQERAEQKRREEKESRREAGGSRFWQVSRLACTLGRKPHLKRDKSAASIAADGGGASSSSFSAISRRDEADAAAGAASEEGTAARRTKWVRALRKQNSRLAAAVIAAVGADESGSGIPSTPHPRAPPTRMPTRNDVGAVSSSVAASAAPPAQAEASATTSGLAGSRRSSADAPANDARQRGRRCTFHQDVSVPSGSGASAGSGDGGSDSGGGSPDATRSDGNGGETSSGGDGSPTPPAPPLTPEEVRLEDATTRLRSLLSKRITEVSEDSSRHTGREEEEGRLSDGP